MALQPYATHAVLGIIAVFFLNTMLKGALDAPFGLLRWGANASVLVRQGEYYRLFAANFLHGNTLHVLMNGLALFYLGTLLERLLGWARFCVIYFTSCFLAMLASAMSAHALMSVGASGGIFGLLGGFAIVSWRLRAQLPLSLRQTPRWWASILIINILLPLLGGVNVDYAAHIAGFFVGGLVTAAFVATRTSLPPAANRFTQALAGAWVLAFAVGLGLAVASAAKTDPAREDHFAHLLLQDPRTDPQSLGNMALLWSANPHSTASQLQTAEDCVNEAIRRDPHNAEFFATLAQVAWRQHDSQRAISASQRAVTIDPEDELLAGQLRRLLLDKDRSPQDSLVPNGMTFLRAADEQHWQIHADKPVPAAGHLFVLLMRDEDDTAALVHVKLGRGAKAPFNAPEDIPNEAGLTARMGAWVPDPSAIEAQRVAWNVWHVTAHDDS
jgi:rhomboid protease GluP